MLCIRSVGELARAMRSSTRELYRIADHADRFVTEYELHDPEKQKVRRVLSPSGPLRRAQSVLLREVFSRSLNRSSHSFGGVPGRNARQNAGRHCASRFAFTTDLADFFPSISRRRIEHVFVDGQQCSEPVGQLLARLCTYGNHLAQGLITSPILADQAVRRVDARIASLCAQHGLTYTRFVDDVTVSGPFSLDKEESGLVALIRRILMDCGFYIAGHKETSGRIDGSDVEITGLRIVHGKLDVAEGYISRLEGHLERHDAYAKGGHLGVSLFTRDQLAGRIGYVCAINQRWTRRLKPRLANIDWESVMTRAARDQLIVCRKRLVRTSRQLANSAPVEGTQD